MIVGCLALNASFEPLTMMPLRRALRLVIDGKAEIVEADSDRVVRSEKLTLPRPAVIRLTRFIHVPRRFRRQVTNTFLFARDRYRCQYCGRLQIELKPRESLTRDHLIPLSRGGANDLADAMRRIGQPSASRAVGLANGSLREAVDRLTNIVSDYVRPLPPFDVRADTDSGVVLIRVDPGPDTLSLAVDQQATVNAPGYQRVGAIYRGAGAEGGRSDWYLPLEGGRCYMFIGAGGAGVRKLYLYLWGPDNRRAADRRGPQPLAVMPFCAPYPGSYHVQAKIDDGAGEYRLGVYVR